MESFDFDTAKTKHMLYSSRLRSYIYGDVKFEQDILKSEHECDLGRWIDGAEKFLRHSKIFGDLQQAHLQIHKQGSEIVTMRKSGSGGLAIAERYKVYDKEMHYLLGLLDKLKAELAEAEA